MFTPLAQVRPNNTATHLNTPTHNSPTHNSLKAIVSTRSVNPLLAMTDPSRVPRSHHSASSSRSSRPSSSRAASSAPPLPPLTRVQQQRQQMRAHQHRQADLARQDHLARNRTIEFGAQALERPRQHERRDSLDSLLNHDENWYNRASTIAGAVGLTGAGLRQSTEGGALHNIGTAAMVGGLGTAAALRIHENFFADPVGRPRDIEEGGYRPARPAPPSIHNRPVPPRPPAPVTPDRTPRVPSRDAADSGQVRLLRRAEQARRQLPAARQALENANTQLQNARRNGAPSETIRELRRSVYDARQRVTNLENRININM